MGSRKLPISISDIQCLRWYCPQCDAGVDVPLNAAISPFNSPHAVAACPECGVEFDGSRESDAGVFWMESLRTALQRCVDSHTAVDLVIKAGATAARRKVPVRSAEVQPAPQ